MTSRFFTQGRSDFESDFESDYESDYEEETHYNRHLQDGSGIEDENDTKHMVKDKRFEEMSSTVESMKNAMKTNDWVSLQEIFDKVNKQLEKVKAPTLYIKTLVMLEDFMNETLANKKAKKKMSTSNSKALNSMKQKWKKNIRLYEEDINKYRESPQVEDDKEPEEDAQEDEDEEDVIVDSEEEEIKEFVDNLSLSKKDKLMEKLFNKDTKEITWDWVNKKFKEIVAARGRNGAAGI